MNVPNGLSSVLVTEPNMKRLKDLIKVAEIVLIIPHSNA